MPITRQPYFLPTQISNCSLWLDATDTSSLTGSSPVTAWKNKIIPANNIPVFASAGGSPSISATAINGNPAMYFNGSSYFTGAISGANTTTITIFLIGSLISPFGGFSGLLCFGNPSQLDYDNVGSLAITMYGGNSSIYGYRNGDAQVVPVSANVPFMYVLQHDGTYVNTFFNGTQQTSVNIASSGTFTYTNYSVASRAGTITGQYIWSGYLGEILVYQSSLNTSQRQQVEGHLAQKWGLTASLPAGHPGLSSVLYKVQQPFLTKIPYFTRFSPRQISGLGLWFDATDSSTITLSSGSLTQWNDKSGNGRNLTAVSGYANATVSSAYQNGLNVFNFSGNGLYRTAAGNVFYPLDVYIVVALKSLTTHVDVLGMGDTSTDNFNSLTFAESAASRWHNGSSGGGRQTISTSDETSLSFLLIQWSIANGNYLLRRNSTQLIQASRSYSFNNSATSIFQIGYRHTDNVYGTSANFRGYIGEIVAFNNQIGTTQRQQIESYLAQKWGLVSSLAAGHLNETFPAGSPTAIQPFVSRIRPAVTYAAIPTYAFKYTYTGSNQSFIVPSAVTSVNVYIWGAGGGAGLGGGGGAGCYVQGVLTVIPGETLTIVVGQGGGNKQRSFGKTYGGGGQGGGPDNGRSDIPASQGGGRSAIVRSSTDLVTAAAGGGGRGARGGRGRLVTGENGTGVVTGGSQSAGGTNNGAIYSGGNANQDNSAGGGAGYYGGGGGGQDQAGGGGSCLTSNLSLLAGESTFGTESSNGVLAPQTSSPYYNSDVAFGATSSYGYNYGSGGNGLVVISFASKTIIATLTYSRLILSAWYGSIAYRFGLDVTTTVNNAFGGNPSNTITLSLATFTDPQVGTTKFTYIVYMFNGIQKFSSAYAEGTVLTFSSLT